MVAEGDCSLMDPEVFGVLQVGKMVLYGLDVNMVHLAGLLWQAWERRSGNTGDKDNNEGAFSFLEGWDSLFIIQSLGTRCLKSPIKMAKIKIYLKSLI